MNLHCDPSGKTSLDPHKDAGWGDDCRRIGAKFVIGILTDPQLRDQIKRHGVRLAGARIDGELDLINADIGTELWIDASRIDGVMDLTGAHLTRLLKLEGTRISGDFSAVRLRADSSLHLSKGATFKGQVLLSGTKVGGLMAMNAAAFEKKVEGNPISVDGALSAGEARFAEPFDLVFAHVAALGSAQFGGEQHRPLGHSHCAGPAARRIAGFAVAACRN